MSTINDDTATAVPRHLRYLKYIHIQDKYINSNWALGVWTLDVQKCITTRVCSFSLTFPTKCM